MMADHDAHGLWAEHHEALSRETATFWGELRVAFQTLHARLYDAPWKREAAVRCETADCGA